MILLHPPPPLLSFFVSYMIKSGHAKQEYVDRAVRHILMRQGVLGVTISIMLDHDPSGKEGPKAPLSDVITIRDIKEEIPLPPSDSIPTFNS